MQEGRTAAMMMMKRNEMAREVEDMKNEMASWRERSEATELAWKECKETYEKRIEMGEKRIELLEAQVASLIEVAGCACIEQMMSKSEPKKVAVAVGEQARSVAKRAQSVASETNAQVERKKESSVKGGSSRGHHEGKGTK